MANCEHIFTKVIERIAEEHKYTDSKITVNPISSGGANYTSKLFTAVISEKNKTDKRDLCLFGKVVTVSKEIRDAMKIEIFDTENYFYDVLMKKYREIEDKYSLNGDQRLHIPEFYGHNQTYLEETVVLEDLFANGYSDYDRFGVMELDYAEVAIAELAKFHALGFAFKALYPEEYQDLLSSNRLKFNPEAMCSYLEGSVTRALETVKPEYKEMLKKFTDKYMGMKFAEFYSPVSKPVLSHLDYRASNLMHKKKENGAIEIKVVDFQSVYEAGPITDLLYFIFTSTDEKFRANNYDKLIDYYYTQLSDALLRFNLIPEELYSRADFNYELELKLPFGLSVAVMSLPILTVEREDAPTLTSMLTDYGSMKTGSLYADRLHGVIEDFVNWGILR